MKPAFAHTFLSVAVSAVTAAAVVAIYVSHPTLVERTPFTSTQPADTAIPDVVEQTIPAVVSIIISADVPVYERYYQQFLSPFGQLFGNGGSFAIPQERQIGTERREVGGGTGFFVSSDGYLITNRHVVDDETASYTVMTNNGATYEATVVAKDPTLDIAILKISPEAPMAFLAFAESTPRLGETVIAIGNALAEFPNSVSVGVISGLSRTIVAGDGMGELATLDGVIQTDAAINRGNSGGPLLTTRGEVVGVNVAVAGGGENIGFALPGNVVHAVYQSVQEHGEIRRPFLGVRTIPLTPEIAAAENLSVTSGALIIPNENGESGVLPDSAAAAANLRDGDVITAINAQSLLAATSLATMLRQYSVGERITLTVQRGEQVEDIEVTLGAVPE